MPPNAAHALENRPHHALQSFCLSCGAKHPHLTSRTTLTASLGRHAEELFPELANISVTTDARMLFTLGYKRSSISPT
ncbi:hypothetical protein OHB54_03405 [Streptomyces sp. NBC_01007]|nr:hypothetical protein OHB54_03405 [Streptomyces sp. NBC_01007]